jgi:hypothetical protein
MKIRCVFTPLVFNERNLTYAPLEKYENFDIITHFRFDLFSLKQELKHDNHDYDYITLEWVEDELIKSSLQYKYEKEMINKKVYFHFMGHSWFYDYNTQNIHMENLDINI